MSPEDGEVCSVGAGAERLTASGWAGDRNGFVVMDETLALGAHALPSISKGALLPCIQVLSGSAAGLIRSIEGSEIVLGRQGSCQLALADPGVSRRHARLFLQEGAVWIEDLASTNGTHVGNKRISQEALQDGDLILVGPTMAKFGYLSVAELELAERMFVSATRDHLTRALNRGSFMDRIEQEITIGNRQGSSFSLVMLDADHFKKINDLHGHPAGDTVLRELCNIIRSTCRLEDVVGRYGGEEFLVLLRNISLEGACAMAERIRRAVEVYTVKLENGVEIVFTVSLGVATWSKGRTSGELIAASDGALYVAKQSGRNCVRQAE